MMEVSFFSNQIIYSSNTRSYSSSSSVFLERRVQTIWARQVCSFKSVQFTSFLYTTRIYLDVSFYNFFYCFTHIVHGNSGGDNLEQQNNLLPNFVKLHNTEKHYEEGDLVELHIEESNGSVVLYGVIKWIGFLPSNLPEFNAKMAGIGKVLIVYALKI